MADPFDAFPDATPSSGPDPWSAFPDAKAAAPVKAEPKAAIVPGRFGIDPSYVGTRLTNLASGLLGAPRALADLIKAGENYVSAKPGTVFAANPVLGAGQILPSGEDIKRFIHDRLGVPEKNTPSEAGKILDAAVEGVMGGALAGPSVILPSAVGSATSQAAGDIPGIKGTKLEPVVRAGTALLAGGGAGLGQNVAGSLLRTAKNTLAIGAPETSAANILGRALTRDEMAASDLNPAPGQPLVMGGGENVKGVLRGSIAAPGQARTTVNNALGGYLEGGDARVNNAIDQNISNLPPLSTRTNTLSEVRSSKSTPAYQAAGIPARIEATEATTPGPMQPSTILDASGNPVMRPGPDVVTKTFNTPTVQSDKLDSLIANSKDIQNAIANARRLPEYKDLPVNSMAMLDKIYKHLGGLAQSAASKENNGAVARDLNILRGQFKDAITEANPAYGTALDTFSEPSKLMDAAKMGSDLFRKNVNSEEVARTYSAMPADQKKEFLGGVADYLRTRMGNSDRGVAAERIWNGSNVRDRLKAILPPTEFNAFDTAMNNEKLAASVSRQVTQGSRTVPMGLEAEDNASQAAGILGNLAKGRYLTAGGQMVNALAGRVGQGRNEAVNNVLAQWLTETDPAKVGMVRSLAAKAQLQALARSQGRTNALTYGATVPAMIGASQGGAP